MLNFDLFMPTRLVFGPGRLDELEHTLHLPAGKRAMVVIGAAGAMLKEGYLARVQGLLAARGVATLVCDRIRPNPESAQIDEAAARAREKEAAFIVGLGGGSTIDAAKSIALMARNPGLYWDYVTGGSGGGQSPAHAALPVVAIPTTAGTGSEADSVSVVTRSGRPEKISWGHPSMFPRLAIVDPDLTLSVPAAMTAYTGMEAFFQAAEALLTPCRQPISDMLALEAIQIISRFLPRAVDDRTDREARTMLMWAGTAAGICGSLSSGLWLHPLAQALGAHAPDLPQGAALTHLSEAYFTWLGEQRPERFDLVAAAMGAPDDASGADGPGRFVAALNALIVEIGLIRESLSTWGLKENRIAGVTHTALATMADIIEVTPVAMTSADVEAILATALRG